MEVSQVSLRLFSIAALCVCIPIGCAHKPVSKTAPTKAEQTVLIAPFVMEPTGEAVDTKIESAPVLSKQESEDQINTWLQTASLEEKVAQMFIFGFMGHKLDEGLKETLEKQKPGAIIVFGRNIKSPKQVVELLFGAQSVAQKSSRLPLLIAVDQEGGNVIRLKTQPPLPSALALGEAGDIKLVYRAGLYTGHLLKTLGFNVNLAPVLDIADPDRDPFLGTRTFGKNPRAASRMGTSFSLGLNDADVMPTAKHFPGHGGVADSHKSTPIKSSTMEMMQNYDLVPFAEGLKNVPQSAVMLAHIAYPKLDPSKIPATFSKPIVTDLLRNSLGFNGLVMTDDIEMAGAFAVRDPNERAIRAIEAGVDIVMIAWNRKLQARAIKAVANAVRSGRISEERIETSVRRVLQSKQKFASLNQVAKPTSAQIRNVLKNREMQDLALETLHRRFMAERSQITEVRSPANDKNSVFVFATQPRFYSGFRDAVTDRDTRFYQMGKTQSFDIGRVFRSNLDAIGVIHVTGAQSARVANRLSPDIAKRFIIVNSETRGLLSNPKMFRNVVDVHFKHPDLGRLTAEYFFNANTQQATQTERAPAASANNSTISEEN